MYIDIISALTYCLLLLIAARIHRAAAGSMHLSRVCPSVRLNTGLQQQIRGCGFAAVGPAGRRYRSIAAQPALCGSGVRMRAVPRHRRT